MRAKILTLRYSASLGGFDDTALVDFARDKEILAVREHFYLVHDTPHITCVLTYQDAIVPREALELAREIPSRMPPPAPRAPSFPHDRRTGAPDPCAGMSESERALFQHLREWRSKQAREEGLPPYLILTNRQLVTLVRRRPESATAVGHIDGIGPGKVERYAQAILRLLHGTPVASGDGAMNPSGGAVEARDGEASATVTAEQVPS